MITNDLLFIFLFWGAWLLIPAITDGTVTAWYLLLSLLPRHYHEPPPLPATGLPKVSVLVPAYNEQVSIDYCLLSIEAQTYPHHLIEIIVVDDGSRDKTSSVVLEHMGKGHEKYLRTSSFTIGMHDFGGVLNLVRRKRDGMTQHGKPAAVNAALALATGDLVVAIDSDVVLEPHAIEHAVREFLAHDDMIAATGHLIIDPYLAFETDSEGRVITTASGLPRSKSLSVSERLLAACQFIEYATAFHLGRRAESLINGMFTMAGACAVYRREAFATTPGTKGYRGRTVSEDTDMTLHLHGLPGRHVGYLSRMRVHLAPTLKWSSLYSQRLRWQRGALEANAVHLQHPHAQRAFWHFVLPLRLQVDHTLTLPRLMWTFLIFLLPLFGYSWGMVAQALGLMLVFYLLMNTLRILTAYIFSSPPEKVFIRQSLSYVALLPLYNLFTFWTRINANILTLTEDAAWTICNPLLEELETIQWEKLAARAVRFFSTFI
jgi:biofilm PGA synthesis N-glycosyltransferase PgaC